MIIIIFVTSSCFSNTCLLSDFIVTGIWIFLCCLPDDEVYPYAVGRLALIF